MLFGGQGAARCDSHSIARDSLNAPARGAAARAMASNFDEIRAAGPSTRLYYCT